MRWPCNKYESFYLLIFSLYIIIDSTTKWSRFKSCATPIRFFLLASQVTFLLITNSLIFLRANDLPNWARKAFTRLLHFILTPLCIYLPVQGVLWQIKNLEESPKCRAVTGSSFLVWSWIVSVSIAGILLGWISCMKLRNWWRICQLRNRMTRLNNLAADGDLNALNELLLGDGDLNEKGGLLPNDVEKLERKSFSGSFMGMITGSQSQTCSACFEDYKADDQVISLPLCEHTFHPECVTRWLLKSPSCPMCRSSVRTDLYNVAPQNQDLESHVN